MRDGRAGRSGITLLLALTLVLAAPASAAVKTWNGGSGSWNVAANWTGGVPANGDDAQFTSGTGTITLPAGVTTQVGQFLFTSTSGAYTFVGGDPNSVLRLNGGGGADVGVQAGAGAVTFQVPLLFNAAELLSNASTSTLTFTDLRLAGNATFDGSGPIVVAGAISDPGGANGITLPTTFTGSLTLLGNNTFRQNTNIQGGTLILGSDTALGTSQVTFHDGATISGTNGTHTLSNTLTLSAASGTINFSGSDLTFSGATKLNNPGTLNVTNTTSFTNFDANGKALTKSGSGTLNLTLTQNTNGALTCSAGSWNISTTNIGSTSSINSGSCPVTLSPGGPGVVDDFSVNGNLSFGAGSTYAVDWISAASFDKVTVTGTVNLTGTSLVVNSGFTPAVGTSLQLVSGTLTGTFSNLPSTGACTSLGGSGRRVRVSYAAGTVTLFSVYDEPGVSGPIASASTYAAGTSTAPNGTTLTLFKNGAQIGTTTVSGGAWSFSGLSPALASGDVITATAGTGNALSCISTSITVLAPTAVRMVNLRAEQTSSGTSVDWTTELEAHSLGFNVYRQEGETFLRLNPDLVAGSAFWVGPAAVLGAGHHRHFEDAGGSTRSEYWVEEVDLDGSSLWYGPVRPTQSALPKRASLLSAAPLSSLGSMKLRSSPTRTDARARTWLAARLVPSVAHSFQTGIRVLVRDDGWYRIEHGALVAAGLGQNVDLKQLHLSSMGREHALLVSGDGVEFYGLGQDTPWTDVGTYWLTVEQTGGARIDPSATMTAPGSTPPSFPFTVEQRDRTLYFAALLNGEGSNFFGPIIGGTPADRTVSTVNLAPGQAQLEVDLQGVTLGAHRVAVSVNGTPVTVVESFGREATTGRIVLPQGLLVEGENHVVLGSLLGAADISLLAALRVTYPRLYRAQDNQLWFSAPERSVLTVDGFSAPNVRVVNVTDPTRPHLVKSQSAGDGAVSFVVPEGEALHRLLAFAETAQRAPASLSAPRPYPEWLRSAAGADFVLIAPSAFQDALRPLRALREAQGWSVAQVDVEDVYDVFNHGDKSPQALRDFLAHAQNTWSTRPHAVLLAGNGSFDPRGFLGVPDTDLVPTWLIDTSYMETASDDAFADFDGDGIADIAIGRLPANSADELRVQVAKILAYDDASSAGGALLVAGGIDPQLDFEAPARQFEGAVAQTLPTQKVFAAELGSSAHQTLLDAFAQGPRLVGYFGHGSMGVWAGGLLSVSDADRFAARRPIVAAMTCLNGFFQDPIAPSLAEALMQSENGAVAVWASSTLTDPLFQTPMALEFASQLTTKRALLGDAIRQAKLATSDSDTRRSWILFGDPTLRAIEPAAPPAAVAEQLVAATGRVQSCGGCNSADGSFGAIAVLVLAWLARARKTKDQP